MCPSWCKKNSWPCQWDVGGAGRQGRGVSFVHQARLLGSPVAEKSDLAVLGWNQKASPEDRTQGKMSECQLKEGLINLARQIKLSWFCLAESIKPACIQGIFCGPIPIKTTTRSMIMTIKMMAAEEGLSIMTEPKITQHVMSANPEMEETTEVRKWGSKQQLNIKPLDSFGPRLSWLNEKQYIKQKNTNNFNDAHCKDPVQILHLIQLVLIESSKERRLY